MILSNKYFGINTIIALIIMIIPGFLHSREQIKAVGSSTVYPFVTIIAETFHYKNTQFKTPVIESTGTGGGINLFCQGLGEKHPDIANASRAIKPAEIALCNKNNIFNIKEIKLGYDAIVIIHPKTMKPVSLSEKQLFLALAAKIPDVHGNLIENPYKRWNEIDSDLPNIPIKVMGPPSGSGTRDSFVELVMSKGCKQLTFNKHYGNNSKEVKNACLSIRTDGVWSTAGENYILLINKVVNSTDLFAVLGYNFYEQNSSLVSTVKIDNIAPTTANLRGKIYPLYRPLFVYIKGEHLDIVPGFNDFAKEIINVNTIGNSGYLTKHGLIPLSREEYSNMITNLNLK